MQAGKAAQLEQCRREHETRVRGQRKTVLKEIWGTKVTISSGHAVGSQVKLLGSHRSHRCRHMSGLCQLLCLGGLMGP